MSHVLFVSPGYITEETRGAFKRHCDSINMQKGNFSHVVVDDASPVNLKEWNYDCGKTFVIRNEENAGSPLASAMKAIKEFSVPDDIIAIVDCDDWLLVDNVPEVLDAVYEDGAEIAWSNFITSKGKPGMCQWFPEIIHPREQWGTSHLKTFRAKLLDRIADLNLRNGDGNYVKYAGDCALYWALLEKSYRRAFIPYFLYCYNIDNPLSERFKSQEDVNKYTDMLAERKQPTRGQPTKRGVVDTGRVCNEECQFCYYAKEDCKKEFVPLENLKECVKQLKDNGRNYVDLTGGEPSIHPDIKELIDYIHSLDMKVCMISNGQKGFDFGCDDYLVSLHGTQETHDALVKHKGAYDKILEGLKTLKTSFRFNCVINKKNCKELPAIAEIMSGFKPRIVNFINFNPYYNWNHSDTNAIQAKYSDFTEELKKAIDILDKNGIGVNVRYLPFCQLKGYERHICGIMQHAFDDYEWLGKDMTSMEALNYENGIRMNNNEINNNACKLCGLQEICDGPNKQYKNKFGVVELKPYVNSGRLSAMDILAFRFTYDKVFVL